jgi:hypothetical protein
MKIQKLTAGLLLVFVSLLFTNCTKDQNESYKSTTSEIISQGKWSVDYFFSGQNITSQYGNYQFNFTGNGSLKASDGLNELSGNWKMIRDVNGNDVLQIRILTQDPYLSELNANWNVTDKQLGSVTMQVAENQLRFKKN